MPSPKGCPRDPNWCSSGRGDAHVHLASARATGEVWDVDRDDLAFTVDEVQAAFRSDGVPISLSKRALHRETEGWPAATGLALMSTDSIGNPHGTSRCHADAWLSI